MSSMSMLNDLLRRGSLPMSFERQNQMSRKHAQGDARGAAAGALTRALLMNAAPGVTPSAHGSGLPTGNPSTVNPLTANLGNLIDLRASLVTRTEDSSLTIRTAEGDTVTLTSHSELQSLKARLTYGPGDPPAGTATAANAAGEPAEKNGDASGVTKLKLREIQLDERVTLSVQGDLSEQELSDIKQLVNRLGGALHELGEHGADHDQDGDEAGGNSSLARIDTQGSGTLAGFELHVERTVEVTKIHVQRVPVPPPTVTPPTVDPASLPGKGTISTPPVALPPAAPKPPVAPRPPVAPDASAPLWKVHVSTAKVSTVADMLYQWRRAADTAQGLPGAPAPRTPMESPISQP